ncbi:uncharacterized protein [Rutidosis leptorrhynchoides]|uniref:uncharacterized protein n=1 Tax=Rutidosis leptorrhynchoides TaxID=125765 RepID=UPI003A99034F
MSIKHLHELLQEDQEPFHIIDFIANHRYQLKSSTTTTIDTTVFLHVPAMLRDAAMRDKDKQSQEISVDDDEQCSPISVLDPSHKDDFERSYSSIQRTKDQLLETLLRFERLVELDPIVLERHLLEQCYKEEHDLGVEKSPSHVKRLALDITVEEKIKEEQVGREIVVRRVCGRLNSWNMVKSKAIGTIVEFEFRSENGEEWKRCDGELNVREIGMHIDVAIFEELLQEFVTSFGE